MLSQNSSILVYGAFGFLIMIILCAAVIIHKTPDSTNTEIIKLRFASVTFTGIMAVFIFTAIMYYAFGGPAAGGQIFDRAVTSMTPLAGVILGYMFGSRTASKGIQVKAKRTEAADDASRE
jgi:hypothetical protein